MNLCVFEGLPVGSHTSQRASCRPCMQIILRKLRRENMQPSIWETCWLLTSTVQSYWKIQLCPTFSTIPAQP